jgi:hypothetical protein
MVKIAIWAGAGIVLVEAAAVSEYLHTIEAKALDKAKCDVTDSVRRTDVERLSKLANAVGKGWGDNSAPYSFIRKVTFDCN